MKSYYLSAVTEQLNKSANPFLARVMQSTSDVLGKDIRKTLSYGINGGIGAGTEIGDLPKSNDNNYIQLSVSLKNLYGTVEITDKALRAAGSGESALVDLLNEEMTGLVKSSSLNLGRMLFGDGSGTLATITSVDGSKATTYNVDSTRNLFEGMIIDVYDTSTLVKAEKREITAVDRTKKQIVISGAPITTPTDYTITLQGSRDLEITGLGALFSDSTMLYGVMRSSWMKPYKKTEVGDLTENELQKAIDAIEERSGSKVNFIVCSWGVRRALYATLSAARTMPTVQLEGGFTALSYNGIPVVADRFCPDGTMYLLNTDDFVLHQLCDWQWMESEDGKILKQVPGKAIYSATLVKYVDLICDRPCGQGMLSGITES